MRRVLIVSPHFPPSTMASVHRARHLAKHLPAAGWTPTVLCVDEAFHSERLDPELAELLPPDLDIVKVRALPASWMRRLGIGDIGLRGYPYLARGLTEIVGKRRVDVVMLTGSPFYPLLLARTVKRRFALPLVVDFQDPWVSDWGAAQPPFTKAWASHQLAKWLEPVAVRNADFITSVSQTQNEELAARYPAFPRERLAALPIGGDPEDYDYLRAHPVGKREVSLSGEAINISYVGTFLPRAAPLVETLFCAVAKLKASGEDWVERLRLNFVGTSNQTDAGLARRVQPIAEKYGIDTLVSETPQRVPYMQALDLLANSHALMLVGSDEPHYTASKIYPALHSGRPILALFHRASSAYEILKRCKDARVFGFETHAELRCLVDPLAAALREISARPEVPGKADRSFTKDYDADAIAARFAAIFELLVR